MEKINYYFFIYKMNTENYIPYISSLNSYNPQEFENLFNIDDNSPFRNYYNSEMYEEDYDTDYLSEYPESIFIKKEPINFFTKTEFKIEIKHKKLCNNKDVIIFKSLDGKIILISLVEFKVIKNDESETSITIPFYRSSGDSSGSVSKNTWIPFVAINFLSERKNFLNVNHFGISDKNLSDNYISKLNEYIHSPFYLNKNTEINLKKYKQSIIIFDNLLNGKIENVGKIESGTKTFIEKIGCILYLIASSYIFGSGIYYNNANNNEENIVKKFYMNISDNYFYKDNKYQKLDNINNFTFINDAQKLNSLLSSSDVDFPYNFFMKQNHNFVNDIFFHQQELLFRLSELIFSERPDSRIYILYEEKYNIDDKFYNKELSKLYTNFNNLILNDKNKYDNIYSFLEKTYGNNFFG